MKIKKWVKIASYSLCLAILIAIAEKRRSNRLCQHVLVDVDNRDENHFVDKEDIRLLMTSAGADRIIGRRYTEIDLKELEKRVETNKYIRKAQVHQDVKGNILIEAKQNRPLVRLLREGAPDAYLGEAGQVLPMSSKYTARVMLVSGPYTATLVSKKIGKDEDVSRVFDLIKYISNDPFWKAQIAQLEIDDEGGIVLYPQVGKQKIEFGPAENIEAKFNKLNVFYEQVLPRKGWNYYKRVNLEYQDQIVCD